MNVPLIKNVTLGDLANFSDLFNTAIGTPIGVSQPILNTNGRDQLTGENLPVASGSLYSDLWSGFQFGVQVNGSETVTPVTVAADDTRTSLNDLVTALNTAFTAAGVDIVASNDSDKLSFTSSNLAVVQQLHTRWPTGRRLPPTTRRTRLGPSSTSTRRARSATSASSTGSSESR